MNAQITENRDLILKQAEYYSQKGNIEAAIKEYHKLLKLYPDSNSVLNTLGDLYVRVGDIETAINIFSRVAEEHCRTGFALQAIAMYKKLLKLSANNYEFCEKIADLYAEQGHLVDARCWYLKTIEAYQKAGITISLKEVVEKIANLEPQNPHQLKQTAKIFEKLNLFTEAEDLLLQTGQLFCQKKDYQKAVECYQYVLSINHNSNRAIKMLADTWLIIGENVKLLDLLNKLLNDDPDNSDLITILGRVYLAINRLSEAEATFDKLARLDVKRCGYLIEVARHFIKQEQIVRAIAIIDRTLELFLAQHQENRLIELLKLISPSATNDFSQLNWLAKLFQRLNANDCLLPILRRMDELAIAEKNQPKAIELLTELTALEPSREDYQQQLAALINNLPLPDIKPGLVDFEVLTDLPLSSNQETAEPHSDKNEDSSPMDCIDLSFIWDESSNDATTKIKNEKDESGLSCAAAINESRDQQSLNIDLSNYCLEYFSSLTGEEIANSAIRNKSAVEYRNIGETLEFKQRLQQECRRAARSKYPISLILVDIDLKNVNSLKEDEAGRQRIIAQLEKPLREVLRRPGDCLIRYSESTFAAILPETDSQGANVVINNMRASLNKINYLDSAPPPIFFGIASTVPIKRILLIEKAQEELEKARNMDLLAEYSSL